MNEILNEQPHVDFLTERGYQMKGNTRYWYKGAVFITFNDKFTKCLILRAHPLRKDTFQRKSQFNVVYRGFNPWDDLEFMGKLWFKLGLHREPKKHKFDHLNEDELFDDSDVLVRF